MHHEAILDVADVCDIDGDALVIDQNEELAASLDILGSIHLDSSARYPTNESPPELAVLPMMLPVQSLKQCRA
jgi:hypothetical protein